MLNGQWTKQNTFIVCDGAFESCEIANFIDISEPLKHNSSVKNYVGFRNYLTTKMLHERVKHLSRNNQQK